MQSPDATGPGTQAGNRRDGNLVAVTHVQLPNASQVCKSSARDASLVALAHVKRVNTAQVRKGGVSDACLSAAAHF